MSRGGTGSLLAPLEALTLDHAAPPPENERPICPSGTAGNGAGPNRLSGF